MTRNFYPKSAVFSALLFFSGCLSTQLVGELSPYVAPPRSGFAFQVPVDILMAPTSAAVVGGGIVSGTDFRLPMNAFDGDIELSFEIVGTMSTSSLEFRVVDSLGNTKASIAPATAVTSTRIRTSMSLVEDGTYRLSVVGNGVYTLQCARILISQKYAAKTATFFPLLSSIATITAGNPVMTLAPGTTYPVFPTNTNLWDYRPTNYKGLDTQEPVVFETVFQSSAGTATLGFVGQNSNFVASETAGDTSLTLRQSTISDLSPLSVETSGFGVRSRADTPAADVRFHRAGIWVKYSNFSKGEIYIRLHTRTGTMAATTFAGNRYLFEPSAWSGTPKFYYEHTGHTAGSNNYYLRYDELDSGSDGASAVGTQIADSVRSVNSSTWMSRRSAPITSLPENGRIFVEHEGGNGHTAWSHFLIVRYQ